MTAAPSARLRLPRSRRLKLGRDFQRARTQGRRLVQGCLILNWLPLPAGEATRLGVITSRKIGAATVRNRARRLLREAFRKHQFELRQPMDMVLVARHSIGSKKFAETERDFLTALQRAGALKAQASQAG
jgi:ribonuclease P protein component